MPSNIALCQILSTASPISQPTQGNCATYSLGRLVQLRCYRMLYLIPADGIHANPEQLKQNTSYES